MRDNEKSKAQLIKDLSALRKQVREFEDLQVGILAEMTSAAIFIYQMNRVKYVNPAATKITGYNRDELLKMNFWEVIHPEFQELVKKRGMARQNGEKVPSRYEIKIQMKGGEERWVDYSARVTTFEQNPAVLGTAVDITERKRTEQALLESEERYRTLSESAFEGIIISVSGKLVMANQAFADMFGYDSHEIIGLSPVEMTTPESAEIIMKNIQSSHEKPYEVIGVRKDGSTFNLEIMGKDCLYKSRKARVTALRDITERKQGEEALRESEAKFRVLAETTSAAIFIFQKNRMRDVNPAASNITGYTQEELLKMNFWEVIHPDFRNLIKKGGLARQKG
ncbi:PAS domain S-box protein, partial [candidate division KSB1 bacterium]|nr:PAS domain S-box protein [candidate division KSB1 bacterium]